jgi:murein DD-endopeptidase MepM/ murein hydrolase activator NlpD
MSYVVKAPRGPGQLRAAIPLVFGCVLLGGCSAGSDRFSSFSFGSGYDPAPQAAIKTAPAPAPEKSAYRPAGVQPASYQPGSGGGYQLASATPAQGNGSLQVSRVDLPPLPPRQEPSGTKMADGYGPYNRPPVPDGVYTAPRVYNPYDGPAGDPPPSGAYPGGERSYGGGAAREEPAPPPKYYRPPNGEAEVYEPRPDGMFRDEPPADEGRNWSYGRRGAESGALSERPGYGGGGRTVIVAPGETLYTLARRWGVTVDMIARANGLTTPYVRPGAVLLIPRADPAAYERAPASAQAGQGVPAAQHAACTGERCHVVKPGDTLASIARFHNLSSKQLADANNLTGSTLKPGQKLIIPAPNQPPRQAFAEQQERAPAPLSQAPKASAPDLGEPSPKTANAAPVPAPAPLKQAPETRTAELQPLPEASCETQLANPLPRMGATFRKPVEGKTIAPFGPQKDGTVNEGITISVPKGTPVKAAENGVVAYAGDELPGFGNLILIRHAGDYITAYAHADTILVKKCDVIKRGQTIATAGTTGDAGQPQLHFEIRKNSKPVDPLPLLGS